MKVRKGHAGGYRGPRDSNGIAAPTTPRMLLDMRKAQLAELQLRREMGSLVDLADVTARRQADAEVIQADLLHVLPAAVSGHAGALGCDAARLRDIVRTEVKKIMEGGADKV